MENNIGTSRLFPPVLTEPVFPGRPSFSKPGMRRDICSNINEKKGRITKVVVEYHKKR